MKTRYFYIMGAAALAVLAAGYFLGHSGSVQSAPAASAKVQAAAPAEHTHEAEIWTCSMHPQIRQNHPGKCPICGMDLVLVVQRPAGDDSVPNALHLSESAAALAEIQTGTVRREVPEFSLRLVGRLAYDETMEKSISARFPARIDKLYVNYDGMSVHAGDVLAQVYSPDLLVAQQELLNAYGSDPDGPMYRSASEKLRLWGLPDEQIGDIISLGHASDHFDIISSVGGVVTKKEVREGDYVKTGQALFEVADLSRLWLILDAYEADIASLKTGQQVQFSVDAIPGGTFSGTIAFIAPGVDPKTRSVSVRADVLNPDASLAPGMFARASVVSKAAEPVLVVPASAVLMTGTRAVVYVQVPGGGQPAFEGRQIVLGPKAGDVYVVREGLAEGERVVTNGAFKIDSSFQIQAKPSMMNPQGGASGVHDMSKMPGMDMGKDTGEEGGSNGN